MAAPAITSARLASHRRSWAPWAGATAGIEIGGIDWALFATLFVVTLTKLFWKPLGKLDLSLVTAWTFVGMFLLRRWAARDWRVPREVAIGALFSLAFIAVYLGGYLNVDTHTGQIQFIKEFLTRLTHLSFMVAMAAYIAERGKAYFVLAMKWFIGGMLVNALYGVGQLVFLAGLHRNLDALVLTPLQFSVGGTRGIQYFGGNLYRINGLMRDTNHLGVTLAVPFAICLAWLRGTKRTVLAGGFLVVGALTLSRSGGVAFLTALIVLAVPFRHRLISVTTAAAAAAVAAALVAFRFAEPTLWQQIVASRFNAHGRSAQTHIGLYHLIPQLVDPHILFGNGLNSFALLFADISGRSQFGPHSAYIQGIVETGLLGFVLLMAWYVYLLRCAYSVHRPLLIGLGAAMIATWIGNIFYLTTEIMYVEVMYAFALAAPFIFRAQPQPEHDNADRHPDPAAQRAQALAVDAS